MSGFIGLAYEGISSFLHNKRQNALHKAVRALDSKAESQHNKLIQLENSMIMYGIYNTEMLEKLTHTVHHIHNTTIYNKRLCEGQSSSLTMKSMYANGMGTQHYSINSLLYLTSIKGKYVLLYKEFIKQLHIYTDSY